MHRRLDRLALEARTARGGRRPRRQGATSRLEADPRGDRCHARRPAVFEIGAHGTHARILEEPGAMAAMAGAEAFGHERLDRLAHELCTRMSEELLGLGIGHDDPAASIDENHRVRGGL